MNILELQDSPGQYRYRIICDKTPLMDWQNGQRSIFDVQINAQRIFGQCDRVRMLRLDGTIEHEWDADKTAGAGLIETSSTSKNGHF